MLKKTLALALILTSLSYSGEFRVENISNNISVPHSSEFEVVVNSNKIICTLPNEIQKAKIEIINLSGKIVATKKIGKKESIDTTKLKPGVYIFQATPIGDLSSDKYTKAISLTRYN